MIRDHDTSIGEYEEAYGAEPDAPDAEFCPECGVGLPLNFKERDGERFCDARCATRARWRADSHAFADAHVWRKVECDRQLLKLHRRRT